MAAYLSNLMTRFKQQSHFVRARPTSLFEPGRHPESTWPAPDLPDSKDRHSVERSGEFQSRPEAPSISSRPPRSTLVDLIDSNPKPDSRRSSEKDQDQSAQPQNGKSPGQLGYLVVQPRFRKEHTLPDSAPLQVEPSDRDDQSDWDLERRTDPQTGSPPQGGQAAIRPQGTSLTPGKPNLFVPPVQKINESRRSPQWNQPGFPDADSSSTETVVNVSIGRVEVVAELPVKANPPQKKNRSKPLMGLDEYLKKRDQERGL